jgi:hypothetical protein
MSEQGTVPAQAVPAKRSHTLRNVLLVLLGLAILGVGGCAAFLAVAANEVTEAVESAEAADALPGGVDNPLTIVEGQAFEVSGFHYAPGWIVTADRSGDVGIEELKVTNGRSEKDSAIVEIKLWSGNEVLALANCSTEPIAVGTTTALDCFSADPLPPEYDRITINDTF